MEETWENIFYSASLNLCMEIYGLMWIDMGQYGHVWTVIAFEGVPSPTRIM